MYGTVDGFINYHVARNNDVPTIDQDDIASAILTASEWIDGKYFVGFIGLKVGGRDQVREWPRSGVIDIYGYGIPTDVVPREVIEATYVAALKELQTPGSLNVDYKPGKYKRVSVEGAINVEYATPTSAADIQGDFPAVSAILYSLLARSPGAGTSPLSGGSSRV